MERVKRQNKEGEKGIYHINREREGVVVFTAVDHMPCDTLCLCD